mmetsp:Transcript_126/g.154  ORF Transcript_126/g.154 Transcript_126/m.154 type:complete len:169 (+) Transcript_126:222-728(+)
MSFFNITTVTDTLMNEVDTRNIGKRVRSKTDQMMDCISDNDGNKMNIDDSLQPDAITRMGSLNDYIDTTTQYFHISKKQRITKQKDDQVANVIVGGYNSTPVCPRVSSTSRLAQGACGHTMVWVCDRCGESDLDMSALNPSLYCDHEEMSLLRAADVLLCQPLNFNCK